MLNLLNKEFQLIVYPHSNILSRHYFITEIVCFPQKNEIQSGRLTRAHGNIHFGNILIETFGEWPGALAAKLADPGVNNRFVHEKAGETSELLQWCASPELERDADELRLFIHMTLLQRLALQHFDRAQADARRHGVPHSALHQEYRQLLVDAYLVLQIALLVFHYRQPAKAPAAAELLFSVPASSPSPTPAGSPQRTISSDPNPNSLSDSASALNIVPTPETDVRLWIPVVSRAPLCPLDLFGAVVEFVRELSTQTYPMLSSPSGNHIERLYYRIKQLYRNGTLLFVVQYSICCVLVVREYIAVLYSSRI